MQLPVAGAATMFLGNESFVFVAYNFVPREATIIVRERGGCQSKSVFRCGTRILCSRSDTVKAFLGVARRSFLLTS